MRQAKWATTARCAREILKLDNVSAEGHFLAGVVAKAAKQPDTAGKSFRKALQSDKRRYDAAIELADLYVRLQRNSEAVALLADSAPLLGNSPLYLEMAAQAYSRLDMHESARPLYQNACRLQPEIERFQAGLAACNVFLGEVSEAREIYLKLLARYPEHQRFHYELALLATVESFGHVKQMKSLLESAALPPERNIFLYYAIGKELEDLGEWDEAFSYYEKGGLAAKSVSPYDVTTDLALIDALIETCDKNWWLGMQPGQSVQSIGKTPVFIVGLPRTGTTLTERIIGSHSQVGSIGETFFLQSALRQVSGVRTAESMSPEIVRAVAERPMASVASRYLSAVSYKLGVEPMFIEKLPENYLYLGFVAKAFPDARIVHLKRHPLDACFAMYKQSYFRYAYTLDDVGRYYVAYAGLMDHWRALLGDRLIEVSYESLVSNQEDETRRLLQRMGIEFETACLQFERNKASSRTASAVQVREKIHTRSVGRWKHFERHLKPLTDFLVSNNIALR